MDTDVNAGLDLDRLIKNAPTTAHRIAFEMLAKAASGGVIEVRQVQVADEALQKDVAALRETVEALKQQLASMPTVQPVEPQLSADDLTELQTCVLTMADELRKARAGVIEADKRLGLLEKRMSAAEEWQSAADGVLIDIPA